MLGTTGSGGRGWVIRGGACLLALALAPACASETPAVQAPAMVAIASAEAPHAPVAAPTAASDATSAREAAPEAPRVEPKPELEIDAKTADGAAAFVDRLCARAKQKDVAWLEAHVSSSVHGNLVVGKDKSGPVLGGVRDAKDLAGTLTFARSTGAPVCDELTAPGRSVVGFAMSGGVARGVIRGPRESHRFAIATDGARPSLVELSVELPAHPVPAKTKPHAFELEGEVLRVLAGDGAAAGRSFKWVVQREPGCVLEAAAREEMGSVVIIRAVKPDEATPATVRVYASTAVSAGLVACLEGQLDRAAAVRLRHAPLDVEYLLRILVPSSAPVDGAADIIMLGPARR